MKGGTVTTSTDTRLPIDDLRSAISGRVIRPGDEGYDDDRHVLLATAPDAHPALIVRPVDAADVARSIDFAREHGLEIAVQSGGHSGAGHGTTDGGLLLHLGDLTSRDIDAEAKTVWAGAGQTAAELSGALSPLGLVIGFGDTGSVGIGGITLGGGVGYLVRKYGLTIDNLLAAEIVTADGEIHVVDATHEPDLFWAVRGGAGNVGVATRFQYRLHTLPQVVGGMLLLPATPETVHGIVRLCEAAPEELSAIINVMPVPPMPFVPAEWHGKLGIMALMTYAGEPDAAGPVLAPFRALAEPIADMLRPMAYVEMFPPEDPSYHPVATSRTFFMDAVDAATAKLIVDRLEAHMADTDAMMVAAQLRVLGGAAGRVPADATAYAHRDARIMGNVAVLVTAADDLPAHVPWVESLTADLRRDDHRAYVNFLSDEGEERVRDAYPGATWDRLAAIKRRYDPDNRFHRNQNVPPA
jgi:FAD/FMN-containing dehydrogenase